MAAVLQPQAVRSAALARVHQALDDPWIAAVHVAEARRSAEDSHSALLFERSGRALAAAGRLVSTVIRWAWAGDDQREEIEADIAAWAHEIREVDGSWTGRFADASPRYRWRVPFTAAGVRVLDGWLSSVVSAADLPEGPEPPPFADLPDDAPAAGDPTAVRETLLSVLDERLMRAAVWPDPVSLGRAGRTRDAVLAAANPTEVEIAWQLGEGLLLIDDSWNAALCAALLAPIEALLSYREDAATEIRDQLLGPGAGSTPFAASVLNDRLAPNIADPERAAGARLGEGGFEALVALRLMEVEAEIELLRPHEGPSMVRRWDTDCPIDSSVWANVPEPGVIR